MAIQNSILNRNNLESNNLKMEVEQFHQDGSGYQYRLSDNFPVLFKKFDPKMQKRNAIIRTNMNLNSLKTMATVEAPSGGLIDPTDSSASSQY